MGKEKVDEIGGALVLLDEAREVVLAVGYQLQSIFCVEIVDVGGGEDGAELLVVGKVGVQSNTADFG